MTDDELRAYIHGKLAESRTAKSTKERVHSVVRFEPSQKADTWKERALRDLDAFGDKSIWAATYLRCGSCYRDFIAWLSENPVDENWGEKAKEIIFKKKWL